MEISVQILASEEENEGVGEGKGKNTRRIMCISSLELPKKNPRVYLFGSAATSLISTFTAASVFSLWK